jgi:cellulose synthase (UDP-forming)
LLSSLHAAFALCAALGLLILIALPLGWQEQILVASALILAAALLDRMLRGPAITVTLMAMSVFSTLRYGYWRTTQTWDGITSAGHVHQWDTIFVLVMLSAEFYAFAMLMLGYFQTVRPLQRQPLPLRGDRQSWPAGDGFIPTYNEPLSLVRATVLGALRMDYPAGKMRVALLDDGNREAFREFAAAVGVAYVTRDGNAHAKAGNINHALAQTSAEFVAIFDSDHVPTRTFLQMTLGWFDHDPRLGLVQTPHHFYSPDPFERNLEQFRRVPNESELFHRLVQDGNDLWNASFFCGSCAVMRRAALDEVGGIAVETVTEDAHTALRMQRRGWNSAYINVPQAGGLATESLSAHIGQRIRWARGMVQILRLENPLLVSGLTIAQRLCYFNAAAHFLFAVPRLVFLTVPLVYLLLGRVNIYGHSLAMFAYALPHIVLSNMASARIQGRHRFSFWSEVYETVLAPYVVAPTLVALIAPRLGTFNVTRKGGVIERSYFDHRIALPFLFLLALNLAGLFMAGRLWVTDPAHHDTVIMNTGWTLYNTMILSIAASVAWEQRQRRADARVDVPVRLTLTTADGRCFPGRAVNLSRGGVAAHLERPARLREGDAVVAAFAHDGSCCRIDARVARSSGVTQHLAFARVGLQQDEYLTSVIYSRPDAWLSWHGSRPADRPLRSLLQILFLGMRGLVLVPLALFTWRPVMRLRRKRAPAIAALVPILCLVPGRLDAAGQRTGVNDARGSSRSAFQEVYELSAIGAPKGVELKGQGAAQNLFFGVPLTKIITSATLSLRYDSPMPSAGTLLLWLNGTPLGSVRLAPGRDARSEVALPTDLLITDNTLVLQLGTCDACGENHPPAVTIDARSTLAIGGSRLPLPNDLSLLPIPFVDPTGQRPWALPVVFSGVPDLTTLQAAAVVASWFGVSSDVRGVRFPVQLGDLPDGNAVVVVLTGSELASRLSIPRDCGSLVAVRENPRDPYGALLIVAGDEPADVLDAARALVTLRGFPQHASFIAPRGVRAPSLERRSAPRWLATDRPSPIGMYTSADRLRLQGSGSVNIYFRLPPDLFLRARPSVPLLLKFGYAGAPHGADAAAHIRLNGQDVDTIRLRPSSSSPVERADIVRLPTGTLRAYANALTVDFDFGRHNQTTDVPQRVAIHRDSSIDLRGIPHSVVLPRLELFADAGFPFTEYPDLGRTAIVLSNAPTLTEYGALLEIAGFFGAQTGSPSTHIGVTDAAHVEAVRDDDLIVLGPPSSQPLLSDWSGSLPLEMGVDAPRAPIDRIRSQWLHPEWPFHDADRGRLAALLATRPRLDMIVEQFVSPFRRDRSVVVIAPGDASNYDAIEAMFLPAVRNGPVYGGVALSLNDEFQSFLVGSRIYRSGDAGGRQRAIVWLFEHYQFLPAFVVLFALVAALEIRRATERVAARRIVAAGTCLALLAVAASSVSAQTREGVDILLSKARSLEARGRMDLAARNWNQVLLVDPDQTEALEGLARLARQNGDADALRRYLERLRKIDPGNPSIEAIEKAHVFTPQELKLLDDASRLAAERKPDDAMAVYRRVFGDTPPPLRWAEAFYETEGASAGGRERAVAQLRDRASREPANEAFRLWLARLLTYDPKTRKEGLGLLESIRDPGALDQARAAWRQALVWEKDNPDAEASLDAYVRRYPDRELQNSLNEQRGFRALREKDLANAQARFEEVLRQTPDDASALVGLGFVRLGLKKFDQALASFSRARELAPERADAREGFDTAKFWLAMQRGAALPPNQSDAAMAAYQEAAALRPGSEQALLAIAQLMQRRGNLADAQARFEQVLKSSPNSVDALIGLGYVRLGQKAFDAAAALFARAQTLDPRRPEIDEGLRSARFWGLMQQGAAALAQNRTDAAIARYQEALAIDARSKDALLGLADAHRRKGNTAAARDAYRQIAAVDPADNRAWLGLVKTANDSNDPRAALETMRAVPPSARAQLEADPEYLARLAQALYRTNQPADADRALRTALDAAMRSDSGDALGVRLEIASFLLNQGRDESAVAIYRHAAEAHKDNSTAWEGLIGAYIHMHDAPKAMTALRSMPRDAYDTATKRQGFLNAVATVYAAQGFCVEAEGLLTRSIDLEKAAGRRPAQSTQLQLASIWSREGRHDRASVSYREALAADNRSASAWTGYITALHDAGQDYTAADAVQRMPADVRTGLMTDSGFLRLLGSVQAAAGNNAQAVDLLQRARDRYRAAGQPPPADLDVQLAWAMTGISKYANELPAFVTATRARADLGKEQRDALDDIAATWTARTAEEAMRAQEPARAITVLTEAGREMPGNPRIRAALASVYLREREYDRALDLYRSWGMTGASAADYRSAVGVALAAGKSVVAEQFLWEGRQRWPNDPELLHMTALQALSHEDYEGTEHYLRAALVAVRASETRDSRASSTPIEPQAGPKTPVAATIVAPGTVGEMSCRPDTGEGFEAGRSRSAVSGAAATNDPAKLGDLQITAQRIQDELAVLRHRNAPSLGIATPLTERLGDPGINRLIVSDNVASGSLTIGDTVRVGVDAHLLDLDSGTPNGGSGYRFGSLPRGATFDRQHVYGWTGDVQVSGDDFGVTFGASPKEFLVHNWTGGVRIGSPDGLVRGIVAREHVKDSLLSYAGARDPDTGIVWGGVVADSAMLQFNRSASGSGQYGSIGVSILHGTNVADNWSAQLTGGAYWKVLDTGHGGLSAGVHVTGMHYDKNLNFFSLGHGGYFSPQRYLLGALPVSWFERRGRVEYEIAASGGVQAIVQNGAAIYPTRSDSDSLEPPYDPDHRRGANYNLALRAAYHVAANVYLEGFAGANNARDFASRTFQIRLTCFFRQLPAGTRLPVKTIPDWTGSRPVKFD